MRESAPTPARTFSTSTSSSSQNSAISFMNEIFVASSAFEAYLVISASRGRMTRMRSRLRTKGVEFTKEPMDRYGAVDASFRDPSGNGWKMIEAR